MPPGATHRHRLAHLPRAARRHRTIRVSTAPFRLAKPSLSPGAMTARAARRHTSSALLLVP